MKNLTIITGVFMLLLSMSSCANKDENNPFLNETEIKDLRNSKEEAKLAKDVNEYSYDKYGDEEFKTTSNKKQEHIDKITNLMKKFKVSDKSSNKAGVFKDEEIQNKYDEFTKLIDKSDKEAYKICSKAEEFRFNGFVTFILHTENDELNVMYSLMECESKNYMRLCYDKVIDISGIFFFDFFNEYSTEFLSQSVFSGIVTSPKETCE